MKMIIPISVVFLLVFMVAGSALAGEVDCSASCNSGERMISFTDGSSVSCSCVVETGMIEQESQNRDVSQDDIDNQSELDAQANS